MIIIIGQTSVCEWVGLQLACITLGGSPVLFYHHGVFIQPFITLHNTNCDTVEKLQATCVTISVNGCNFFILG